MKFKFIFLIPLILFIIGLLFLNRTLIVVGLNSFFILIFMFLIYKLYKIGIKKILKYSSPIRIKDL